VENREEDGKKINIVTRGGEKTGVDVVNKDQDPYRGIRKNTEPKKKFDACKEKETFKEARQNIFKANIVSTSGTNLVDYIPVYDMPKLFDHTSREHPLESIINLRNILRSCVKFMNGEKYLQVLQSLLEK
jgi:hypothetical protein